MNLYSFSTLCFSFGVLLVSLLVIAKCKDAVATRFLFFSISVSGWGFLISFWIGQNYSGNVTLLLTRISHLFAVFIPVTWVHFIFDYIGKKEPFRGFYKINYGIAAFFAAFALTPFFIKEVHPVLNFKYFTGAGPLYHFFIFIFVTLIPYAFYFLFREYLAAKGQVREQLKYLVLGTFLGFTAGGLTIPPIYWIPVPQFFLILMPLYPLLTGIALIRHGLFDTQQILDAFRRDKLAAIGTLATSINHEIRNPLYIIQGLSQSFLANFSEGIFKDDAAALQKSTEILTKTEAQAARAVDIMKRFAMFAKQDVKQSPQTERVDLNQVLADVLPLVSHELELDKIELIQKIPQDLSPVNADRRHLEEILFNLIVNACQAMKNEASRDGQKSRIEISAEPQDGHVNLLVKDNGPGIPAESLKQIFEPFYTTKEQGTGLGLYVTRQLVEKNRGKITVTSKPGGGTGFLLRFPRAAEKEPEGKKIRPRADNPLNPITQPLKGK